MAFVADMTDLRINLSLGLVKFQQVAVLKMKSTVKEVPMLHFGENKFLVNMKTLLVGLYFGKIFIDLTPPQ